MYPSICIFYLEFWLLCICCSYWALMRLWFFMWEGLRGLLACWPALTNEYWEFRSSVLLYFLFFRPFGSSMGALPPIGYEPLRFLLLFYLLWLPGSGGGSLLLAAELSKGLGSASTLCCSAEPCRWPRDPFCGE